MKDKRRKTIFSGITKNILILGFVSLFTDLSSQMVFPLIPLFLTSVVGTGASVVGIVEGAAEATASLLKVVSGWWSDKIERRKPFVLFGYLLSSIMKPLFAFASTWPLVLFIRVIERIGKGIRTAPRDALVAESSEVNVRGKAYGFHRAMDGIGSTLGAVLAFLLLPALGYRKIFLFAFLPAIASVFIILFVKESKTENGRNKEEQKKISVSLRKLPLNLRIFIVISSIFALGHFGYAFLLLKAKNIGLADNMAILMYVLFYVVYTLCTMPVGVISDKIGRKPILIVGYSVFALSAFGLIFASTLPSIVVFFIIYGIFFAKIDGAQRAYVVDLAPPQLKATALGTFHTAIGLVALPGGYIAGLLWDKINPAATFIYGFILACISAIMLLLVKEKKIAN
jgi:MFS family permease